ncbi:fimbrial protein [Oleiagrimonas citrea]|uniref:Fimbrial protein n=1 Tax=Oleiagrimonas citrea TaxID=1665687 RepID=A0A846ZLQ4_9GAMM|nr:fimbrial protein [Oleiagrimonas citrea]NKZ38617.1 fimbrial protein [Oleiagrimonas citrea]
MMRHATTPNRSSGHLRQALLLVSLLLGLLFLPRAARADCGFVSGSATTVTFNAGTITLTPSTQVGAVLWTSNSASPANPPELACDGNTNGGIFNTIAASTPVNGDNRLFPTGIPGISYRLLHPDSSTLLALYPYYPTGSGTFSVPTNLQLVYTGPYLPPDNSTLSGQLSQWKIDICDNPRINGNQFFGYSYRGCRGSVSPQPVETFNVNAIIHIQVPTCTIDPGSVTKSVTLPFVNTQQLTAQGTTAASTPFSLLLTQCPNGLHVFITLDTSTPQAGATGVIAPTTGTGYASGVGVQILQADGVTPVTFGSAINTGTTAASSYTIDLYARYYQTATTVSSGNVKGVATYTINYQ